MTVGTGLPDPDTLGVPEEDVVPLCDDDGAPLRVPDALGEPVGDAVESCEDEADALGVPETLAVLVNVEDTLPL